VPADFAFFGEKDYQQLIVIRRMARDLNMPIEVVACPTVREPDGLAMSSRNAYLSDIERAQAKSLSRALFAAVEEAARGERDVARLVEAAR
ncbi:MAG: pantoate--beta-alanine ligase, partial [Phycisphaerales bacterium]